MDFETGEQAFELTIEGGYESFSVFDQSELRPGTKVKRYQNHWSSVVYHPQLFILKNHGVIEKYDIDVNCKRIKKSDAL